MCAIDFKSNKNESQSGQIFRISYGNQIKCEQVLLNGWVSGKFLFT